jgi:outer membrane immunogenic protein
MKRLFTLGVGLLSTLAALPAIAADMPIKSPERQQQRAAPQQQQAQRSANWNGGQLGGSNGASAVNNNFVEPGAYVCGAGETFGTNCFETPITFSGHQTSYTVGPFLGWRWQLGTYVAGIEADWSWKKASTSSSFNTPSECYLGPGAFCRSDAKSGTVSQNWDSSFRLRYGYLVTPFTLVYATGGLAISEITGSFNFSSTILGGGPGGTAYSNSTWSDVRTGGTVGAGVETELWAGWKARLEYRYTDFGAYTKNVPVTTACPTCVSQSSSASIDLRESFHTVRVGLGFDF